ncbi:MAG: hypothetical protein ACM3PE_07795, partial [Deltaproteobacteria bacterium]
MDDNLIRVINTWANKYKEMGSLLNSSFVQAAIKQQKIISQLSINFETINKLVAIAQKLQSLPDRMMNLAIKASSKGWTIPFDMPLPMLWYIADTDD